MAGMVARVETVFKDHRGDSLGSGTSGIVCTVTADIAVKTAEKYDCHPPGFAENEDIKRNKKESAVFAILMKPQNWHPNVILAFLQSSDYIFMERALEDLHDHITSRPRLGSEAAYHLISEIIDAAAWLEQLGILHGDLRPTNILLSRDGHVKLCDFDNICFFGKYIQVGNEPYYEPLEDGAFGMAESGAEQGAIGCCAFFICTGTEPGDRSHHTNHIPLFGGIIRKCWDGEYQSIKQLGEHLVTAVADQTFNATEACKHRASLMSTDEYQTRVTECREYLSRSGFSSTVADS